MSKLSQTTLIAVLLTLTATTAAAQSAATPGQEIDALGRELVKLAVVVLIVESALAAIFNWRVYRAVFNSRALKTPIMFLVGIVIVVAYDFDIFERVVSIATPSLPEASALRTALSSILSGLIIAGGTTGINSVFQRLGLRNPVAEAPTGPALKQDEAWISIQVTKRQAIGSIQISIKEIAAANERPLAGTVSEKSLCERLSGTFRSSSMRYPNYGGRVVKVGQGYEIALLYNKRDANGIVQAEDVVFLGSFAPRAVIDFHFTA